MPDLAAGLRHGDQAVGEVRGRLLVQEHLSRKGRGMHVGHQTGLETLIVADFDFRAMRGYTSVNKNI